MAARVERALGPERVWGDRSRNRLGTLLGRELLTNIRKSRTLVLLWSATARASPWVQSEWIAAVNLGRRVLPLVLDGAPLPQCLANTLWQAPRRSFTTAMRELVRTVRGPAARGGSVGPAMRLPNASRDAAIDRLGEAQFGMLDALTAGRARDARARQARLERDIRALLRRYPLDPRAAVLWAYNAKNRVLLEHGQEIDAGIRIEDDRLEDARWRFLHALWLDPFAAEALNGLGTIAWFGHDLESAEFFVRTALRREPGYPAAVQDLATIRSLARRLRRTGAAG
jgi:hypothetical protein